MKSEMRTGVLISTLIIALTSCSTAPNKQDVGTITGGVLGGVLGAQVGQGTGRNVAIIAGTLAGAYLGSSIGKSMDETDRLNTARTMERNPTGQASIWRNPDTGNTYNVTPTRTYETATGPCRDFTTKAVIDGKKEVVQGKACRQADGSWKTM